MSWLLRAGLGLRSLIVPDDEREAFAIVDEAEHARAREALEAADVPARAMAAARSAGPTICLGTSLDAHGREFAITLPENEVRGGGHWLMTGSTGTGKTFLAIAILMQLIRRRHGGIVVLDMKGELAGLLREVVLPSLVASLPDAAAADLVSRIAVIAPFDESATPPFNVLARDRSMPVEVQAHEVATTFGRTIGRELGVLQATLLKYALLLAIDVGLTLPDVPRLLQDEELRRGALGACRLDDVRLYFADRFPRERQASLGSLLSRLDSLLMYPVLRRMLVARGMIRFDRLLEHAITIVDVGGTRAPAGMRELQQFFGQVLFQKLVRAIFSRRVEPDTPSVTILADEFQELVQPDIANDFERVLALARSQRCFLWASFQQAAQVEAVSPVLMRVLRTNTNTQVMFRSSLEDARPLAHIMPATGQLRRDADGFPDPRNPPPLVPVEEERRMLLERVPSAPDRVFWMWLRREQHPAMLATSPVLRLDGMRRRAAALDPAVRALVARGVLASSPEQIQQAQLDRARRLEALAGRQADAPDAPDGDDSRIGDVEPDVEPPPVEARASAPQAASAPHRREARPSARGRGRGRGGPRLG